MDILKDKHVKRLMIGKFTSMLGSNMQQFALSLYVFSITGSAAIFASMLAISILPRILLSPVAGVFGDWFDRKKTIVRLDVLNGFLMGAYALYYYLNDGLSLLSIYVLVVILEIIEIFFASAMGAVIPSMVPKEKLFEANTVKSIISSIATIASPMIASTLYAFFGLPLMLALNAITYMISALMEMTIHMPAYHTQPQSINLKAFKEDLLDGLHMIKKHKVLLNIIGLGIFLNFSLSPLFSVGLIFLLFDVLGVTEIQYGLVTTLAACSMLIGPIVLGKKAQQMQVGKLLIMTFTLIGGIIFILALVTSPAVLGLFVTNTWPLMIITGIVFVIAMLTTLTNIALGTLFDTLVPKEFLGRAGSVMNIGLMASIPLGQMLFGLSIDYISPTFTIGLVAVIVLGATLYFKKPFMTKENEGTVCDTNFTQMKVES